MEFLQKIYGWYADNKRDLPWRSTKDAYKIWLSEIILQQTRVNQGMSYYHQFIDHFPSVFDLASADEDQVLKLWQGLGYYSRARNLHKAAKYIVEQHGGKLPRDYKDLIKIPGVGDYTASAISSIAFNENNAVVDGNVYRVFSRIFGIITPIDSTVGKKEFKQLAQQLLSKKQSGMHNQALMEFGALQCTSGMPNCGNCPVLKNCYAYNNTMQTALPVKSKRIVKKERYFYYLLLLYEDKTYLQKRKAQDIWKGLYQPLLIEKKHQISDVELAYLVKKTIKNEGYSVKEISDYHKHILTHQTIYARLAVVELNDEPKNKTTFVTIKKKELAKFAIPKLVENLLINVGVL